MDIVSLFNFQIEYVYVLVVLSQCLLFNVGF